MRVVGGRHRGRKLLAPADQRIRPTSDRAREALFSLLEHRGGIAGRRFLDLCAGTGAVGLEAFSRAAAEVLLVESDPVALALIRRNRALIGDPDEVRILAADATRLPDADRAYDIAFLDPPYGSALVPLILSGLLRGWLGVASTVVVELGARQPFTLPEPFRIEDQRRYGAARFIFLSASEPASA